MALGVLNNLSAIYAENNLNNTNASLQTVLQQLSSGSRINSGADDAAGLSLVNGLAANSAALVQSETNATEGVGLLQVADGALSQVTNLLNRAITLATEASNGTLNSTQEGAANQEYQTILAEINNIGSTTTYNQEQVFGGSDIAIYTGDSSTAGSSIDKLNIRPVSVSSVGDTGGVMSYTNGENNVFLNLSTGTANAKTTDTLNSSGATTIDVNYLVNGASGSQTAASTQITVGTGTNYANTVSGLVTALNDAGLGLTATFTTQSGAGVIGGGTQTGIEITGGLISAGIDPASVSTGGELNPAGIPADQLLTIGQTVTVNEGSTQAAQVTIGSDVNTLTELAAAINAQAGAGTASVITNGDGTQSLALADTSASDGVLSVNVTSGAGASAPIFGTPSTAVDAPALTAVSGSVTGTAAVTATNGSYTFGTGGTNAGTDVLSAGGSITLSNTLSGGTVTDTFIVGSGTDGGGTYYTGNHGGNTVADLMATINAGDLQANATVSSAGITVTSTIAAAGDDITAGANTLTQANNTFGLYSPTLGGPGVYATALLQLNTTNPDLTAVDDASDPLTGSFSVASNGVTNTYVIGNGVNGGGTYYTNTSTITADNLAAFMNANNTTGLSATVPGGGSGAIYLQAGTPGSAYDISMSASTLADVAGLGETTATSAAGVTGVTGVDSTVTLGLASGTVNTSDALASGSSISLTNGAVTHVFTVGHGTSDSSTTYLAAGTTLAELAASISGTTGLGLTAQANTTGLTLTSSVPEGTGISVNSNSLADGAQGSHSTVTLGTFLSESSTMSGTLTFSVGGVAQSLALNAGSTVEGMINQINADPSLGVQAAWVPTSNGFGNVVLTSSSEGVAGQIASPISALVDTTSTATLSYTAGSAYNTGLSSDAANVVYDSTSGQNATTGAATFVSNARSGSGIATISYSDGAGQSLSGTDLLNQADAQSALNSLNLSISDVASMDGYIGAQINTLNSISQVMSTQQENVVSAQNAIQATDYAAATSNMSKYEILSQTGIAALAQANSVQQEVTKLLQ
jgi:flagellin